jgi:O-antigen/teichoic acid export membrane protein
MGSRERAQLQPAGDDRVRSQGHHDEDGGGVVDLFAWQCGVAAVSLAAFAWIARSRLRPLCPHPRGSLESLRRVRGFATGIAFTSILAFALTQIDKILLSKLLPLADFGLYVLASSLADALALLAAPFYTALLPRFAQLIGRGNEQEVADLYLRAARLLAAVLAPCAGLLIVFGDSVVLVWSGSASLGLQIAPLVAVLACGRMVNCFMQIPAALQVAWGWVSLGVKLNAVAVLVLVPLLLITVPEHGAIAYAWCWVALNLGYLFVGTMLMHRRLLPGVRNRWAWEAVLRPVALVLACMLAARALFDVPDQRVALGLVLAVVFAVALGLTLVAARAHREFHRLRH